MPKDERQVQRIRERWSKHIYGVAEQQFMSRQVMQGRFDKAIQDIKTLLEMVERGE